MVLHLTRPREVLHTQFDCPMVTKVVVAITWLPVGIDVMSHHVMSRDHRALRTGSRAFLFPALGHQTDNGQSVLLEI